MCYVIIDLMASWKIEYYETFSGRCPPFEFIEALPLGFQARIRNAFRLLIEFGPKVGPPYFAWV